MNGFLELGGSTKLLSVAEFHPPQACRHHRKNCKDAATSGNGPFERAGAAIGIDTEYEFDPVGTSCRDEHRNGKKAEQCRLNFRTSHNYHLV